VYILLFHVTLRREDMDWQPEVAQPPVNDLLIQSLTRVACIHGSGRTRVGLGHKIFKRGWIRMSIVHYVNTVSGIRVTIVFSKLNKVTFASHVKFAGA